LTGPLIRRILVPVSRALTLGTGSRPVHGLDDVAAHSEVAQDALGVKINHPLTWPCSRGETHAVQLLQPADGETARLRIIDARMVRPQVDEAGVVYG
jgi:hypothetical protein